ncbi:MAG: hypothetical protein V3V08_12930 [Nannocystaceae bacterium]
MSRAARSRALPLHTSRFFLMASVCLAVAYPVRAAPSTPVPDPPDPPAATTRLNRFFLETSGIDDDALVHALRLRLHGVRVDMFRAHANTAVSSPSLILYARVVRLDPTYVLVTVIVSDGRGYRRRIEAQREVEARVIAANLAVLSHGIVDASVEPDRSDAEIPTPRTSVAKANARTNATGEGKVPTSSDPPVKPPPASRPAHSTGPDHPTLIAPSHHTPDPSTPALGVAASAGSILGLAPGHPAPTPHFAAQLDLRYINPSRLHGSITLRLGTHGVGPYLLRRYRIGAGGGWSLESGRFELPIGITATIEPWTIRGPEGRATVTSTGEAARYHPLVGATLGVAPSFRFQAPHAPRLSWRIGTTIEGAASAEFADGPGVPRLSDPQGSPVLQLGGFELNVGIQLTTWFRHHPRRVPHTSL